MVPPNILLRLATSPDPSKKNIIYDLPQHYKPLDSWSGDPFLGEVRFSPDTLKCYKYTENGWEEVK